MKGKTGILPLLLHNPAQRLPGAGQGSVPQHRQHPAARALSRRVGVQERGAALQFQLPENEQHLWDAQGI